MNERELISMNDVAPETIQWCWTNRIPLGGITLLDGDPGHGKSLIMYDLSARVTTGRPMPFSDDVVGPAGVVLLQAEDLLGATVRPNLEAAGADVSRIAVFDRRRFAEEPFVLPDDISVIEKAIDSTGAKLVVIDPLPAFLGNPNSEASVRKAFSKLAVLAEAKKVAIVIVRHLTKGRSSNTKYRGGGSIGIIGAARSALFVGHDPSSDNPHQHVLALNKSNLSDAPSLTYRTVKRDAAITVEWLGESTHTVDALSESASDQFAYSQLEEACYVLYAILSEHDEPMPAKEAQAKAGAALVSPRTLKRAKKRLGITSRRITIRPDEDGEPTIQWVWELPDADAPLRPYRDRAMKEQMQDGPLDNIDAVINFRAGRLLITMGIGRSRKIAQSNFCIKRANHCEQPIPYSQRETGKAQDTRWKSLMPLSSSLLFPTHANPNDASKGVNSAGSPRHRPSQAAINGCGVHDSTISSPLGGC